MSFTQQVSKNAIPRPELRASSRRGPLAGKRIVILLENLPYPQDRRVRLEAEALQDAGAEVTVLAPAVEGQQLREKVSRIDVRRFPRGREGRGLAGYVREYLSAFLHFARMLRGLHVEGRIDVLHACTPPDLFFPLAWVCRLNGTTFVFDHHDPSPELFLEKGGSRWGLTYWALRVAEWLSLRSAAAVIASSQPLADLARRRGGVPSDRVFLVRSGLKPGGIPMGSPPTARSRNRVVVAYVGVMSSHDGLDSLVEAARAIRQDFNRADVNWLMIGDGPEKPAIENRVAVLGLRDHFHFTGFVSAEVELAALLQGADICVTPDPLTPFNACCLMAKVLDYLAAGRAQVAFPLPETKEVAGPAALFVEQNSAAALAAGIIQLVDNVGMRQRLEAEARGQASRHMWSKSIPSLLAAYSFALGRNA